MWGQDRSLCPTTGTCQIEIHNLVHVGHKIKKKSLKITHHDEGRKSEEKTLVFEVSQHENVQNRDGTGKPKAIRKKIQKLELVQ